MPTRTRKIDQLPPPERGPVRSEGPTAAVRSLAHDLRSPLASLQSCLNLVLSGETGDLSPDQRRYLGLARRNIDRLDRLVEDMLTVSRHELADVPVRRRATDLGPLLKESVRLHGLTAQERGLEIDARVPATFPALVDPDLVVRLLDNLLGNAVKHGRAGGHVRVWLEAGAGPPRSLAVRLARQTGVALATFHLIVEDDGPGLDPSVRGRMFDPYNRGARSAGTGLGLSVVRQLADAQGGEVRVASVPGRGTIVWLKLPRDPATEQFLQTVAKVEEDLSLVTAAGIPPLAGVLDLRQGPGGSDDVRRNLDEFFRGRPSGRAPGRELAPGLWVAAVMDPVNWSRRWSLFAARKGGGLEATRWDFLPHGPQPEQSGREAPGEERSETRVNSSTTEPM